MVDIQRRAKKNFLISTSIRCLLFKIIQRLCLVKFFTSSYIIWYVEKLFLIITSLQKINTKKKLQITLLHAIKTQREITKKEDFTQRKLLDFCRHVKIKWIKWHYQDEMAFTRLIQTEHDSLLIAKMQCINQGVQKWSVLWTLAAWNLKVFNECVEQILKL